MSIEKNIERIADALEALVEIKKTPVAKKPKAVKVTVEPSPVESVPVVAPPVPTAPVVEASPVPTAPSVPVVEAPPPTVPSMTGDELNQQLQSIAAQLGDSGGEKIFNLLNGAPFNAKGITDLKESDYANFHDAAKALLNE